MNRNSAYPSLPEGPIVCKACADAGKDVEMAPHLLEAEHAKSAELASYRCPECENVAVFQVS